MYHSGALTAGGSAGGCLVRGPPGGLSGRLVAGVLADHRENGLGVRVIQSRYSLEDLFRLLEPADPLEFREVEREPLLTEIKVTDRAEHIGDQPCDVRSLGLEFGGQIGAFRIETGQLGKLRLGVAAELGPVRRLAPGGPGPLAEPAHNRYRRGPRGGVSVRREGKQLPRGLRTSSARARRSARSADRLAWTASSASSGRRTGGSTGGRSNMFVKSRMRGSLSATVHQPNERRCVTTGIFLSKCSTRILTGPLLGTPPGR